MPSSLINDMSNISIKLDKLNNLSQREVFIITEPKDIGQRQKIKFVLLNELIKSMKARMIPFGIVN